MKKALKRNFTRGLHLALKLVGLDRQNTVTCIPEPKRLLLLNPAHIGDIVISTSLLGVLKSAYPKVEIGFATASWSHPVIRNHPLVNHTHIIDHWRMSRENLNLARKFLRYFQTRQKALREIRSLQYDTAICLQNGSIDLLNLVWRAGIPNRIAFNQGFWAPVATLLAQYPEKELFRQHGDCQAEVLRTMGIPDHHFTHRQSSLASSTPKAIAELCCLLNVEEPQQKPYCVIHMASGANFRELPISFWHEVASIISRDSCVIFTGKGPRDQQKADQAMAGLTNCINACNKLSWEGFVTAIRFAQVAYGVESMSSQVAAAVGTKCVAIFTGAAGVGRWRPLGEDCTVWTNHLPCAPCHRARGCEQMTCLSQIEPSQIIHNSSIQSEEQPGARVIASAYSSAASVQ